MVLAMAKYGPRLVRYSGVSGLVGSHGRSQDALRTRASRQMAASLTLIGRRLTGASSSAGSVSVTHPRDRATKPSLRDASMIRYRVARRNQANTECVGPARMTLRAREHAD